MIILDRVQGVSPSKLPGQGRHAQEPLVPAKVIRKVVKNKSSGLVCQIGIYIVQLEEQWQPKANVE